MLAARHDDDDDENYKTRQIDADLYKRLKFDHTYKLYMYKPKFVPENETHKILLNFDM